MPESVDAGPIVEALQSQIDITLCLTRFDDGHQLLAGPESRAHSEARRIIGQRLHLQFALQAERREHTPDGDEARVGIPLWLRSGGLGRRRWAKVRCGCAGGCRRRGPSSLHTAGERLPAAHGRLCVRGRVTFTGDPRAFPAARRRGRRARSSGRLPARLLGLSGHARSQSPISSEAYSSARTAATLSSARIDWAIRPPLPMTLP